jgi:hypothetical protein
MYQQQHFAHLPYNPMNEDLLETYPHLEALFPPFPEVKRIEPDGDDEEQKIIEPQMDFKGKKGNILRYVIAMYDPASPLIKNHQLLPSRQAMAAKVAGFDDNDNDLKFLFELSDEEQFIPELIVNYLQEYSNSMAYAGMVANEAVYWEYVRRMMRFEAGADDDTMKSKMGDELSKIQDRVEAARKRFFGDDEKLRETMQQLKRKKNSPESWARAK